MRTAVIVLGDLGRSPRMLYHAQGLAELGPVDLIGYAGSELPEELAASPAVSVHRLPEPRPLPTRPAWRTMLSAAARVAGQTIRLLHLLVLKLERPHSILVQSPPALPTLVVAWLAARLRAARLVVDWHNLGYAMLGLKLGEGHPAVRLAARAERSFGRLADAHLCVSESMKTRLAKDWRIDRRPGPKVRPIAVLHDRPTDRFRPTPEPVARDLLRRLQAQLEGAGEALTALVEGRPDRPALLVSPTSWSVDEDFAPLLEALARYDRKLAAGPRPHPPLPDLLVLLTGRGPLRSRYEAELAALELRRVIARTLWLEPEDYPRLLGAADLGLSLHRSASGLDLPIKLADMLGSGLPVCALDYGPVLAESFRQPEHGLLFADGAQLAERLQALLAGFPGSDSRLATLQAALRAQPAERWEPAWRAIAAPLLMPGSQTAPQRADTAA